LGSFWSLARGSTRFGVKTNWVRNPFKACLRKQIAQT
jgi:hypothetical protein